MRTEDLKQALDDCVINFDRRVLLTDLLQEYEMPYAELDKVLSAFVEQQEKKGAKFEKRFLVSGSEENSNNEVYTVVQGETKLREWLRKLKNAESSLYSIETAGGAKTPADIFQPMIWCANRIQMKIREPLKWGAAVSNGATNGNVKTEVKKEEKKPKGLNFTPKPREEKASTSNQPKVEKETKKSSPPTKKVSPPVKKTTPESKPPTPEEQKKTAASNAIIKKGIAGFFGAAANNNKTESKKASGVIKPPTPKKMQDFFKKPDKSGETEKASKQEDKSDRHNTSVQLFSAEDEDEPMNKSVDQSLKIVDVDTSDDEAHLENLRKECAGSDNEETPTGSSINKRRRIIDSDDEDEPEVKHEKKEEEEKVEVIDSDETETTNASETYLDEDGFVVTIKAKKSAVTKKPAKKEKTPEKISPKEQTSKKASKTSTKTPAPKTKQGNIMSFFTKK